jgi:hypothetical protein
MTVGMRSMNMSVLLSSIWRYSVAMLLAISFLSIAIHAQQIEANIDSNNTGDEGGVSIVDSPRRAGSKGFRHYVPSGSNRAEFAGNRVAVGKTYWYGWSFMHPSSPSIPSEGHTILSQWFVGNRPASDWPCGGAGHKVSARDGELVFNLQYSTSGGSAITCKTFNLATFDQIKDKWVDIVVNAKWTANTDGFVKLWIRIGGDSGTWVQKINYTGRSQASGSDGPYFKYGAYTDKNGPRVVYTDEYRLHGSSSGFDDVAPGGSGSPTSSPTPTPSTSTTIISDDCSNISNFTKISGGTWASSNGQCVLTGAASVSSGIGNLLVHNTAITGDFTLTANGSAPSTSSSWDDFAIIFNYQNSTNYYYAHFSESNSTTANGIFRVLDGTHSQLVDFTTMTTAGTTLHTIKVERVGSSIKVYRGSTLMGQATDSNFTGGKVGLGTTNNNANFDNLKVTQ